MSEVARIAGARPKISMRGVWMTFPAKDRSAQDVHVLEDIALDVREGEFICLVGPSGCGKSTLLNIAGGFLKATAGEMLVDDRPVIGPDPKRIFIFQENGVFPWMTVEENVAFGVKRPNEEERRELVRHYIEMVGLTGFDRAYPQELSGGMKQRVEIARALAAEPDVLFMDEPFGALDYLTRLRLRHELIQIWQRERRTVLFVTHDVEEAVQLADRVVVMGKRPSRIKAILPVPVPRPRDLDDPVCRKLRDEIFGIMGLDHHGQRIAAAAAMGT
ncbi:MAG: NitT/TauT family transport system ATP-binding protein [Acidobacteriota bacterium]|jgi:NitT/TauT family transport system ATP-binding protein|nr:NitT/TauT family transport system ATP-binding protein [Acidobacteriota bacterium]